MRLIFSLLLNGLLVYICSRILPGVSINEFITAVLVGLLLGLANYFVRPILTLLTLPITFLTLGLFLLVINGAMVLLVDSLVTGFSVDGLLWAIVFSVLLTFLNSFVSRYQLKKKEEE